MHIPTSTIISTFLFAFAMVFSIYDSETEQIENRRRVWEIFDRHDSPIKSIGVISVICSLFIAIYLGPWYSGAVVFLVGLFLGLLLLKILHWYIQPVSLIGLLICYVILVKMMIEA